MHPIATLLRTGRRPLTARRAIGAVVWLVLFAGMFALWPTSLGGRVSYVRVSGTSMEPTMHTGDLAVVRRQSSYSAGDIVAFRIPKGAPGAGHLVIHRIIGGDGTAGYRLQGDNRGHPDVWRPMKAGVVGSRWALVPRAGSLVSGLAHPFVLATILGLLTVVLVVTYRPEPAPEIDAAAKL